MLDVLDKELERRRLKFVRYADDFSIYCKSKSEAREIGNEISIFLKNKLSLPVNFEKSGIRRPTTFKLLGYGFVPTYKKGEKDERTISKGVEYDSARRERTAKADG